MDDFHQKWEPLGYSLAVHRAWTEVSIGDTQFLHPKYSPDWYTYQGGLSRASNLVRASNMVTDQQTRDAIQQQKWSHPVEFAEAWWDTVNGDAKLATEWARWGFTPPEVESFRRYVRVSSPHRGYVLAKEGLDPSALARVAQRQPDGKFSLSLSTKGSNKKSFGFGIQSIRMTGALVQLADLEIIATESIAALLEMHKCGEVLHNRYGTTDEMFAQVLNDVEMLRSIITPLIQHESDRYVESAVIDCVGMASNRYDTWRRDDFLALLGKLENERQFRLMAEWYFSALDQMNGFTLQDVETLILDEVPVGWAQAHLDVNR